MWEQDIIKLIFFCFLPVLPDKEQVLTPVFGKHRKENGKIICTTGEKNSS